MLSDKLRSIHSSQFQITTILGKSENSIGNSSKAESLFLQSSLVLKEIQKNTAVESVFEESPISADHLFSVVDSDGLSVGASFKVLMLGVPGVGKSTLLSYLIHQWSQNKIWLEQFDYVFHLKLKLLSSDWRGPYGSDIDENPVECFIHSCLVFDNDARSLSVTVNDIISIANRDKVLLLLDGYDEIVNCVTDNTRIESKFMKNVHLKYSNILVTSRHNAVDDKTIAANFNRLIENAGVDFMQVKQYVKNHFSHGVEHGEELLQLLSSNSQVLEICKVPMNIALLCLIWSDGEARQSFAKSSLTVGVLYNGIVQWLTKRYESKLQSSGDNSDLNFAAEKILQFLDTVAFSAFNESPDQKFNVISKGLSRTTLKQLRVSDAKLAIGCVNQFGVLRALKRSVALLDQDFEFIHLTFQEYFTAIHLFNDLLSDSSSVVASAVKLIGMHRANPRYFMSLKLLAGLVTNYSESEKSDNTNKLLSRFWGAVASNLDGIMEVGADRKITLLMHLLSQSTKNGLSELKLPILNSVVNFVDGTVLKEEDCGRNSVYLNRIIYWRNSLVESSYLSVKMEPCVFGTFEMLVSNDFDGENTLSIVKLLPLIEKFKHRFGIEKFVDLLIKILIRFNRFDNVSVTALRAITETLKDFANFLTPEKLKITIAGLMTVMQRREKLSGLAIIAAACITGENQEFYKTCMKNICLIVNTLFGEIDPDALVELTLMCRLPEGRVPSTLLSSCYNSIADKELDASSKLSVLNCAWRIVAEYVVSNKIGVGACLSKYCQLVKFFPVDVKIPKEFCEYAADISYIDKESIEFFDLLIPSLVSHKMDREINSIGDRLFEFAFQRSTFEESEMLLSLKLLLKHKTLYGFRLVENLTTSLPEWKLKLGPLSFVTPSCNVESVVLLKMSILVELLPDFPDRMKAAIEYLNGESRHGNGDVVHEGLRHMTKVVTKHLPCEFKTLFKLIGYAFKCGEPCVSVAKECAIELIQNVGDADRKYMFNACLTSRESNANMVFFMVELERKMPDSEDTLKLLDTLIATSLNFFMDQTNVPSMIISLVEKIERKSVFVVQALEKFVNNLSKCNAKDATDPLDDRALVLVNAARVLVKRNIESEGDIQANWNILSFLNWKVLDHSEQIRAGSAQLLRCAFEIAPSSQLVTTVQDYISKMTANDPFGFLTGYTLDAFLVIVDFAKADAEVVDLILALGVIKLNELNPSLQAIGIQIISNVTLFKSDEQVNNVVKLLIEQFDAIFREERIPPMAAQMGLYNQSIPWEQWCTENQVMYDQVRPQLQTMIKFTSGSFIRTAICKSILLLLPRLTAQSILDLFEKLIVEIDELPSDDFSGQLELIVRCLQKLVVSLTHEHAMRLTSKFVNMCYFNVSQGPAQAIFDTLMELLKVESNAQFASNYVLERHMTQNNPFFYTQVMPRIAVDHVELIEDQYVLLATESLVSCLNASSKMPATFISLRRLCQRLAVVDRESLNNVHDMMMNKCKIQDFQPTLPLIFTELVFSMSHCDKSDCDNFQNLTRVFAEEFHRKEDLEYYFIVFDALIGFTADVLTNNFDTIIDWFSSYQPGPKRSSQERTPEEMLRFTSHLSLFFNLFDVNQLNLFVERALEFCKTGYEADSYFDLCIKSVYHILKLIVGRIDVEHLEMIMTSVSNWCNFILKKHGFLPSSGYEGDAFIVLNGANEETTSKIYNWLKEHRKLIPGALEAMKEIVHQFSVSHLYDLYVKYSGMLYSSDSEYIDPLVFLPALTSNVSQIPSQIKDFDGSIVLVLFGIIGDTVDKQNDSQDKQNLYTAAKNAVSHFQSVFAVDKIDWALLNFDVLTAVSSESVVFLEHLFKQVLSSGQLNSDVAKYIIKVIDALQLTVMISKPAKNTEGLLEFFIVYGPLTRNYSGDIEKYANEIWSSVAKLASALNAPQPIFTDHWNIDSSTAQLEVVDNTCKVDDLRKTSSTHLPSVSLSGPENPVLQQLLQNAYAKKCTLPKLIDDDDVPVQSLVDYYIKLNIVLREKSGQVMSFDKVTGDKAPIDVKELIDDSNRVLMLGAAGVGKTTLMHYISYQWGQNKMWADKFDFVFRVKLRLLTGNWESSYGENLDSKPLLCFIAHCLIMDDIVVKRDFILALQNTDRILLLVDGFDEVAHLANKKDNRAYRVMQQIFDFKHVILTSRPNAVDRRLEDKFDRKVENIGLDKSGIDKYIKLNFSNNQELEIEIKSFVGNNRQMYEICTVPINTALLCLIWRDETVRRKFEGGIEIGQIYHELVHWMGKRYFVKFLEREMHNISEAEVFGCPELRWTTDMAYEGFLSGELAVSPEIAQKSSDKFSDTFLEDVLKFGLLRPEDNDKPFNKKSQYFVHLTFQEFLCACQLRDLLASLSTRRETADFIAKHRQEPRYAVVWKFLASLTFHDTSPDRELLFELFWECMVCNIDGVLEFGVQSKLSQTFMVLSSFSEETRQKNAIMKKISDVLDNEVARSIAQNGEVLISSGYFSTVLLNSAKLTVDGFLNLLSQSHNSVTVREGLQSISLYFSLALRSGNNQLLDAACVCLLEFLPFRQTQDCVLSCFLQFFDMGFVSHSTYWFRLRSSMQRLVEANQVFTNHVLLNSWHLDISCENFRQNIRSAALKEDDQNADQAVEIFNNWDQALSAVKAVENQYDEESIQYLLMNLDGILASEKRLSDQVMILLTITGNLTKLESAEGNMLFKGAMDGLSELVLNLGDTDLKNLNPKAMLAASVQAVPVLIKIFHAILSKGSILGDIHSELLREIFQGNHFSFQLSRDMVFTLENSVYHITDTESIIVLKGLLAVAIDSETSNLFQRQYLCHSPVFPNKLLILKLAAVDLPDRLSITNATDRHVTTQGWCLSLMYLTNQSRTVPDTCFLVLERRNEFGDYEVHKVKFVEGKMHVKHWTFASSKEIHSDFLNEIIDPMVYKNSKPRYLLSVLERLDYQSGRQLIDFQNQLECQSIAELLAKRIDKSLLLSHGLLLPWKEYCVHPKTIELTKYQLLGLVEGSAGWQEVHRDSLLIQHQFILDKVNIQDLESLLIKHRSSAEDDLKREQIGQSNYKHALYQSLRWQLNAVYLASMTVSSGMVQNQASGLTGNIGVLLETVSRYTPLVGIGVCLFGQVLQGIDETTQAKKIDNFAHFVGDSNEMSLLAEKLALELTVLDLKPSEASATADGSLLAALSQFTSLQEVLQKGLVGLTAQAYESIRQRVSDASQPDENGKQGLSGFAKKVVFGVKPDDLQEETAAGESDAGIIARFLIDVICHGRLSDGTDVNTKLRELVSLVKTKFSNTESSVPKPPSPSSPSPVPNVDMKYSPSTPEERTVFDAFQRYLVACDMDDLSCDKPNREKMFFQDFGKALGKRPELLAEEIDKDALSNAIVIVLTKKAVASRSADGKSYQLTNSFVTDSNFFVNIIDQIEIALGVEKDMPPTASSSAGPANTASGGKGRKVVPEETIGGDGKADKEKCIVC